jgi:hypothetical protein
MVYYIVVRVRLKRVTAYRAEQYSLPVAAFQHAGSLLPGKARIIVSTVANSSGYPSRPGLGKGLAAGG